VPGSRATRPPPVTAVDPAAAEGTHSRESLNDHSRRSRHESGARHRCQAAAIRPIGPAVAAATCPGAPSGAGLRARTPRCNRPHPDQAKNTVPDHFRNAHHTPMKWSVSQLSQPPTSTVEPGLASARLGLPLRDFGGRVLRGSWLVAGVGLGPGRWEPLGARLAAHDREAPVGAGLRRQESTSSTAGPRGVRQRREDPGSPCFAADRGSIGFPHEHRGHRSHP
jgi:hypothetical protein